MRHLLWLECLFVVSLLHVACEIKRSGLHADCSSLYLIYKALTVIDYKRYYIRKSASKRSACSVWNMTENLRSRLLSCNRIHQHTQLVAVMQAGVVDFRLRSDVD